MYLQGVRYPKPGFYITVSKMQRSPIQVVLVSVEGLSATVKVQMGNGAGHRRLHYTREGHGQGTVEQIASGRPSKSLHL